MNGAPPLLPAPPWRQLDPLLGLAISRRIARLLGGDLWVDDAVGGGVAFILSVPVLPPDTSAPATRAASTLSDLATGILCRGAMNYHIPVR